MNTIDKKESVVQFSLGRHFFEIFSSMVVFRGLKAEEELLHHFGEKRLLEFYEGHEPRFSELLMIADTLSFPLSAFQLRSIGDIAELEIAYAEVLYKAYSLNAEERSELAKKVLSLVHEDTADNDLFNTVPDNHPIKSNSHAGK